MKRTDIAYLTESSGYVLVIILVIVTTLSLLTLMGIRLNSITASSIHGLSEGEKAYYIAEAGYENGLFRLKENPNWRGSIVGQSFGGGQYSVEVSQPDSNDDIIITSTGEIGSIRKVIVKTIASTSKPFIIRTYAGNGSRGYGGDGGPAVNAMLNKPRSIYIDSSGNVYIADTDNHIIRFINTANGNIYTIAGIPGQKGYNCNDCPPLSAKLKKPSGIFVDRGGTIYMADKDNHIIRKIPPGGNIIIVAGKAKKKGYSGDGGPATKAKLKKPQDVVVDNNGNIYIADTDNCRIRKVTVSTGIITTYAGNGICAYGGDGGLATNASFNKPKGLAIDSAGNLYIADTNNNRIRKINAVTGIVTTVAGTGIKGYSGDGGAATSAMLNKPEGLAISSSGIIYIADTGNNRIRKVNTSGIITTYAGNGVKGYGGDGGPPADAQLKKPTDVAIFNDVEGHILIADKDNNRIREVTNAY